MALSGTCVVPVPANGDTRIIAVADSIASYLHAETAPHEDGTRRGQQISVAGDCVIADGAVIVGTATAVVKVDSSSVNILKRTPSNIYSPAVAVVVGDDHATGLA